ncbi:MAG: SDR family oxidoreductase [Gemmatimonadota bacterium]|nr:SDR family oxidoreductase [Gemmatimonadota bacterium]
MNCLITGGAGFIGSNLVKSLISDGNNVRVLDNFSTGTRKNVRPFLSEIDLVEGDLRCYHVVHRAAKDVDFIFHLAALASVPRSIKNPVATNEVNVDGTLNVLNAALTNGVRRVIFASSSSTYGDHPARSLREDMPSRPISPYGVSKLAGEKYCQVFTSIHGLETVCLRYFNVFGPAQDGSSEYAGVVAKFITAILQGRKVSVHGRGNQTRDFTYVDNVVQGNLLAAKTKNVAGEVFNIAYGAQTSINEVLAHLQQLTGSPVEVARQRIRAGDIRHSQADIGKARELLGYSPSVNVAEGLERSLKWYTGILKP